MDSIINLTTLKEHLSKLIMFGEAQLETTEVKDGHKIELFEYEEGMLVDSGDEVVEEHHSTRVLITTLYTNKDSEICFIEHPFGAFSKSNKKLVPVLLDLIGQRIKIAM